MSNPRLTLNYQWGMGGLTGEVKPNATSTASERGNGIEVYAARTWLGTSKYNKKSRIPAGFSIIYISVSLFYIILPLRPLESLARALLAVFLTLFHTRVAREETLFAQ